MVGVNTLERSLPLNPIHDEINKIYLNLIVSCIGPLDVIIQFLLITVVETGCHDVRFYFTKKTYVQEGS